MDERKTNIMPNAPLDWRRHNKCNAASAVNTEISHVITRRTRAL